MKNDDSFDLELEKFNSGNLPDSHIFNLGKPGEILQNCGFPAEHRIELAASRLRMKAKQGNHPFEILDIQGLAGALQKPVAVFEYGDKNKSQNVIVNIEKDGKNFLVGVFFNQIRDGFEVSSIRGLFNRDNMDWMHWIQQGKMIYGNKEKIQVLAEQQRTNLADVHSKEARTSSDSYYLDSVDNILQSFGDVKDIYTKDFPKYAEQKENTFGKELFEKIKNKQELSFSESQKLYPNIVDLSEEFGNQAPSEKEVLEKLRSMVGEIYATSTDGKSLRIPQGRDKLSHIFKGDNYKRDFRKKRELNRKLAYNAEKIIGNALFTEAELPKPEKNKDYLLGMHNYEVPVFVNGHGFLVRLEGEVIKKLSTSAPGSIPVQKNTSIESNIDNNELLLKLQATEVSNLYVIRKQKVLFQKGKMIYGNKEKSQENQYAALLMAQGLDSLDSNKILHQTNSLVNKTPSTLVIDSNQAARIKAAREIKENMPNLSENERTAAIAILEAGAKSQGVEFSEYVEKTFPDGIFGDIKKAENAAKQQGVNINGAVSVNGFGENVKAVIYAGKTADFSTWCHELSHIWQAQLAGELKNDAEEAFQVKDSDWQNSIYTFKDGHTDTSAEAFAYGFEDFLKNKAGEMAAEDKKKIFEKFADYMSRTYNGVKQHIEINEKIASVYQKFVELDDNILAQAEKAVRLEIEQEQKINEIFNSPNFKTSQKVSETIGLVSDKFAALASQYRYDIKGYSHTIDNFFVNHALKQHGDKETEEKRGNVAITYSDICNVFSVYTHPDYIVFGTKTKTGNPAIVYVKNIGDSTIFVEDVRRGKKELAAQTLYKKSGTIDVSSKKEAPELYAHSDPESISIVDVKKEFVNESKNEFLQREKKIAQVESFQTHSPSNQNNSTDAKNANISFQPVDDSYTLFQSAYHGSSANFDKFNTSEYGLSGDGAMAFGYGVYVSNSETIARSYAGIQGERNLYTVEIPDGDYIIWNKTISKLQKEKVKNELYENLIKEDYKGVEKEISTELNNVFSEDFDGKKLYGTISSYIGSDKETSRFFKDIGFSGIEYPAGTPENAVNYVIFDDNDIKIKNHFQFQIIGELGARELDRNAESNERIENLETAKRMEEAEKDANVIRLATGWEKGADGKWKYEIDDSKVHFNLYDAMEEWDEMHPRYEELREKLFKTELSEEEHKEFDQWVDERNEVSDKHTDMDFSEKLLGKTFRLPEVMRHNELFKAYPELKYVTVSIKKTGENGTLGNASYEDKHINLYRHEKDTDGFEEWEKKAGSVLLHEVQHIIQGIEGFAKGASPEMFEESPEASEQSSIGRKIVADGKSFMSAMEAYRASAGEVESRNVQTRMRFTPKQRINTLLSDTADIAPKDQIVMFDVPTSESRDIKNTNEEHSVALKADSKENKMGIISATMKSATKDFMDLNATSITEEKSMKSTETFESQEYWKNQFQQENADTFKAIDDYLDKGIRPKGEIFSFSKSPEILKFSEISENTIQFSTKVINKARNTHNLTNEEIKSALINIASPVLIFDSDINSSENKENSVLLIANSMASSNKPLAITLNMNVNAEIGRKEIIINEIRSIHDRTLIAKNGTDLIQKWTENGLCRYVDDKKISEWQLAARVQFPLAVLHSDKNNILPESNIVNGKKISERQLAAGEQFPLAVLHSDINNINLSPEIVNSTDYQEIRTFSEFAEQQKDMEKEYQEYLGTISPDEKSSRRIDSGEIFGKLENQQSKEELNVATYKFQSGETLDEIIQGNSDFSTETALLDNLIDNSIREVYEYATNEEKSVLRQFAAFRNDYDTDMKNLAVQTDCISRWIAAEHWNPEKQEFQEEYVNQSAIKDFPYKLPWEMKEIEDKVLKTENEIFDNGIESIQVNGGMSEATIEAEIRSQEKDHHEVEEYNDGQLPLQVVAHTDFNYFNSDKISFKEYIVRTDASVVQDLIEKNADSFTETNSKLEENAIPCIIVRKSVNPKIPDQFLLSKYENNNLNKDEIAKQAGKFASKEIKIENTELITQIKNVIDWNDKQNKTQAAIPELKIYHTLKEDEENISQVAEKSINEQKTKLQIIEQEDKEQLAAIVMTARKTIKESLAQNAEPLVEVDFSKANYDMLFPRAIVQTPLETVKLGENQFEKLDAKDRKRFLLATFQTLATPDLVIDEEREGKHSHNYIKSFVFDEKTKTIQDVVVNINGENVSITAHPRDINNIVNKIKMPDQLVYAAAKVGQVIEQRTQEAQSIVNPTRDDRLSTISVPLNKEYNENFALSTVEKLLETEKNAQKATAADFQQIEPALQKKFDKLKAAIKSREEQDIQDISAAEEPGNKKKAIRSKSDIIRQAGKDFLKSVKEGIAPFFNAEDDFQRIIMHPQAIINASNGLPFSGESQLLAQIYHQRQRMEGEVVTSIAGAKAAGTIVLDTPESRQKNFALTDTSSLAEKNAIVRTRYFMPESCEEPDKIYAHTLQRQRPDKIRSYRDLIRHFENIPNGQKEISDIRIRIAHEHLKEIQSRFAIKEKRVLSVDEIEERKNFLRNYFERLPADYRNSERSAFEDTFGIQLNSEKNLEINLQRDFKDIDFAELKKNTKKSIELENRKLSDFIEKNTMENKKLATLLSDEYKSLSKEEKMTVRNLKIEAIGIKEPETFLGKYLAACNTNAEFITDKETVEEVKKNLVKKLEENFKLEKYDILKEIGQQAQSIGNETTKKISFEKAHSNNKSLEKTQSPDKEISLIGMGK